VSGWLHTAEGGQASTEVVQERLAGGYLVRKHPGNVKFDDITVTCGTGMSQQFYDWVKASISYDHQRKEGAIVAADYDFKEVNRLNFYHGLITEVGFPALDASSKEPCKMTVKISPERTDMEFSGRTKSIRPAPIQADKQKMWLPSFFRLKIDGGSESLNCTRVSKVDAIVIKQKVIENAVGEELVFDKEPAQIDFPNLVITLPEADAQGWYQWHKSFVIDGKSEQENEKSGTLEYLAADKSTVLFTLTFQQLGIIKFQPDKLESASDKLRTVKIEMYCESINFEYKPIATWQ
jgi:hypothetical protein